MKGLFERWKSEMEEDGIDTTFAMWDISALLAFFLMYGAASTIEISQEWPASSVRIAVICFIYIVVYGIFKYLRD